MRQIKVTVSTGWANGDHVDYFEVSEFWDDITKEEQEKLLNDYALDSLHNYCDTFAEIIEDDEE